MNEISQKLLEQASKSEALLKGFANMAGGKLLRFIDGNFAAQGWQGGKFSYWKKRKKENKRSLGKKILSGKGTLRNSWNYGEVSPGIVKVYNNVAYARSHNEGGLQNVSSHQRISKKGKTFNVGAFSRDMPKRQFAPINFDDSPVLIESIEREIFKQLKDFKP